LTEGERWSQAWTPKIYDRSPPLCSGVPQFPIYCTFVFVRNKFVSHYIVCLA